MKTKNNTTKTILVRDLKVGDSVTFSEDNPHAYQITRIFPYGTSHHSLIIEFDSILPNGMCEAQMNVMTKLILID